MASRYAGMPISESRCGLPSVRVRPLPKNLPHYVRRARMCDGTWCRGPNDCTFAHNELELNQWNMLLQQRGMYSIERCVMRGINYLSLGGKAGLWGSKIRNLFIIFVVIFIRLVSFLRLGHDMHINCNYCYTSKLSFMSGWANRGDLIVSNCFFVHPYIVSWSIYS